MITWHSTKKTPAPKDRKILLCWEKGSLPNCERFVSVGAWQGQYYTCQLSQVPSTRRLDSVKPSYWAEINMPEDPTY